MKKILSLLTIFSSLVPGVIVTKNTIGCGVNNNMVKIYQLFEKDLNKWEPGIHDNFLIIELDKTTVEKYTLRKSLDGSLTQIKFYFKDETTNETSKKYWNGPVDEYAKYIKSLIGLDPTEESE
ncbi:hypothetical protein [Spiroplasma endosymbiont of Diplazon laetatorius]|uniref:hypothetical protein n=1 Tax=Spiroplasma endosymbiont of Diplazon laetatorius TaxID=3066322 RepID=UPI0030CB5DCF